MKRNVIVEYATSIVICCLLINGCSFSKTITPVIVNDNKDDPLFQNSEALKSDNYRYSAELPQYYNLMGDERFQQYLVNNPIDSALNELELLTYDQIIAQHQVFTEYWLEEIKYTLIQLEAVLLEDDYSHLVESQDSWENYMLNTFQLQQSIFYLYSRYGSGDGYSYPKVSVLKYEKTRERAYELLTYLYAITGEVTFIFESNKGEAT